MAMNLRTVSWTIAGLAVAAAAAWYLFAAEPVAVDTAQANRGSIEVTVTAEGETRVREVYSISAPITGKLERLNLHVGDNVVKAQRVASLRPVDPPIRDVRSRLELAAATRASEAAVGVAEAQVRQANSALTFARAEFDRASELVKRKVISQAAMDQAELNIRVREAELKQAEAALELRRQELATARAREMEPLQLSASVSEDQCCMAVAAPVAGTVLRIVTESEQVVQAGAPILELGDTADLEIVVDLLSTDAVGVMPGMEARIEDWGGEGLLEAKVRRIDPAGFTKVSALGIEEQRVNAILDFTGPPERRASLGHAFKVLVRIVRSRAENALQVPIGALFRHDGNWAAYTVEDGAARLKELQLGRFSMTHAEVLGGLSDADTVIVHPGDQVADGVAVRRR
ncbi:MAG: HlyD family efflux transporter periplasmic adaptor subunit [Anderseniella sp.]|jgi:HlyD family secretion protein|nr:HlyD family efflux transporter periplasmic adaptor subunit [Anderseniella sp.]